MLVKYMEWSHCSVVFINTDNSKTVKIDVGLMQQIANSIDRALLNSVISDEIKKTNIIVR